MNRINSLSDLLIEEMSDLLNAENQLVENLPKMAEASQSPELTSALEDCLKITKGHIKRLQDIFSSIHQNPQKVICKAMQGLMAEARDSDAAIINVAQRIQEYEIARYKSVREHAADLGHSLIVEVFTKTLNEDRGMNFHFNELAQGLINIQAIEPHSGSPKPKAGGFYIPEGKFSRGRIKKKPKDASR